MNSKPVNYKEAVEYIESIPKFTQKHTQEHTREFLERLGRPAFDRKVVHVAGTNGKGSVCAYIQAILEAEGKKTGFFTSPHLISINERIQIGRKPIDNEEFYQVFEHVYDVVNKMEEEGSTQAQAEENHYYIGSIDTTCSLSNYIGPAALTSSVIISIRLKQKAASGAEVYTPLISPRLVVGSQDIPIVFPRIRGAYGVENGTVEVVDVEKDAVITSYPGSFFPVG